MKTTRAGTPATTDAELEERYLALLESNRGRIGRLCRAFARREADREDLEGEVCCQLWRSLASFDGRSSEDTWLYRVALNTCLLHGRSERHRRAGREAYAREPRRAARPAEAVERRLEVDRLLSEIRRLDPADRALVTLHLEELPYARIAEITGLTESNVGVRLHRLKKRLAERLQAETAGRPRDDHPEEADHARR